MAKSTPTISPPRPLAQASRRPEKARQTPGLQAETDMNEIELPRLYEDQMVAQVKNGGLPAHDRHAAAAVLAMTSRLLGAPSCARWASPGPGSSPSRLAYATAL